MMIILIIITIIITIIIIIKQQRGLPRVLAGALGELRQHLSTTKETPDPETISFRT